MKKYINRPLFLAAIVISLVVGLEMPFNTFTYSFVFYLIEHKAVHLVIPSILGIIVVYGVLAGLEYIQSVIVNRNVCQINTRLKDDYVTRTLATVAAENSDYEARNLSFFMNDLKLLEDNYWRQLFTLLGLVVTTVGTLGYALFTNVPIALVFIGFAVVPSLIPRLFSQSIQTKTRVWSAKNETLSGTVKDLFHAALLLKRYQAVTGFSARLHRSVSEMEGANAAMNNRIALANFAAFFTFSSLNYIPIGIGIYLTITGKLSLSGFVAIQYATNIGLNSFRQMLSSWNAFNSTQDIRQKVLALDQPEQPATSAVTPVTFHDLALQTVGFTYDQRPVFDQLNLQFKAGDKVLIRGKSGIGKSTLIRLILRELQPTDGMFLLNGQPYTQQEAYRLFGIVGQSPVIFQDTIKNNVTLGRPAEDAAVATALRQAGLPEFTQETGLNQLISENGHNLSGGQLKRIEIARALFFNRQILLIDEGTASLDPETAQAIHESLLRNPDLTVLEVDHHIPEAVRQLYTASYQLTPNGLTALTD